MEKFALKNRKFLSFIGKLGFITMIVVMNVTESVAPVAAYEKYKKVTKYDRHFSKYAKRYFGDHLEWIYFKAQAIAESNLDADAQSEDGAVGIMQIMPSTFNDIRKENPGIRGSLKKPEWNIAAGIYYDKLLWNEWQAERSFQDRINFMFASYNAGKAAILEAQKIAMEKGLDPTLWGNIEKTLWEVNGEASHETVQYVRRINRIQEILKNAGSSFPSSVAGLLRRTGAKASNFAESTTDKSRYRME